MPKAVCFDFFNTLARYEPTREDTYVAICREFGIQTDAKEIARSLPAADKFWRDQNRLSAIDNRSKEDQMIFWAQYITMVLQGTGTKIDTKTALAIMGRMRQFNWEFKVFDDSISTLKTVKQRGLITGLISNVGKDLEETYQKLGIQPYLDFIVTSFEVGCDKPNPEIFQAALKKAKARPEEVIYVGDQYDQDVLGAQGVGIKAVLIDRRSWYKDIADCPKIQGLSEIINYL
jgi:putative hydrolase of the HAD superfamily